MTTTTTSISQWVIARLRQIRPTVTVYDGGVPSTVKLTPGTQAVAPYVAVWATPVREADETSLAPLRDEGRAGDLTLTVAGSTATTVTNLADTIIGLFHRQATPGGGEYELQRPFLSVGFDEQVTPGRYYVPLNFRLLTTH